MESNNKDLFFVEIREPNEIKRNILESMKDMVENLQRFEKFKDIRKEKIRTINKLGGDLKELNKLISNLKNSLPESKLRVIKVNAVLRESHKVKPSKKKEYKKRKITEEKKPVTELERLESELSVIEEKLGSLR